MARFFSKEDRNYRISAELRSNVVFTVHDVLADPPFARLDFVSCRNLLIYLLPEAQAKVISIIHFALRDGGVLLVGDAETVGVADGRFAVVSKPQRIYRRVRSAKPGDFGLSSSAGDGSRPRARPGPAPIPARQIDFAELCRRMVLEAYGPAAVLINHKLECLHFQGPIDRYLKVAPGRPAHELIAMAREGVRGKLRSAVQRALRENARVVAPGGQTKGEAVASSFSIVVTPAPREREDLLLVCFDAKPESQVVGGGSTAPADVPRIVELQRELEATKNELQNTIRNLAGAILIVEDDPEVREHLELFLNEEGYQTWAAVDGHDALESLARGTTRPDLVLADYNLPHGMNGVQASQRLRQELDRQIPVIILTGDISTETLRDIARHDCVHLNKPVKLNDLMRAIEKLLAKPPDAHVLTPHHSGETSSASGTAAIIVVDDDDQVREAIRALLEDDGRVVDDYASCQAFLKAFDPGKSACLLIDAYLPGMTGLQLLEKLQDEGHRLPAIMITGNADVPIAVQAMKAGALDFIEKPIGRDELIAAIDRALELSQDAAKLAKLRESAAAHLADLTPRQRDVMDRVLAGQPSKNIAADLGISQRTVENHRASIMKRSGSKSLPALARLALLASGGAEEPSPAL